MMFRKKKPMEVKSEENIQGKITKTIVDFYTENRYSFLHLKLSRREIIEWYWTTEITMHIFEYLKAFMNDELSYIYLLGAKISKVDEKEVVKELEKNKINP